MSLADRAIIKTNDLPIRHVGDVHNGKVRSVYWLTPEDSLNVSNHFGLREQHLGVMVISDRISAFECLWESESGLKGVPGKGAALNAISKYWFDTFEQKGLAGNHIVDSPHPLVWIVQRAKPVMVEAIARQYITGSMWRGYAAGNREICGIPLSDDLKQNQRLDELLLTPSTKGIMRGIPGVPEEDDTNITRQQIVDNYAAFGFRSVDDIAVYEKCLREGFGVIDEGYASIGRIFVDTKFEFGYAVTPDGNLALIYIDEVGTPDSSRMWNKVLYASTGATKEESKERFREGLLEGVPDSDVLTDKTRMDERVKLAETYRVPDELMLEVSGLYTGLAKEITGKPIPAIENAKEEIVDALAPLGIIEKAK